MSDRLDVIAARTRIGLEQAEWALTYKRLLRDRCNEKGEHDLAASLNQDIAELERRVSVHRLAIALVKGAQQ